MNSEDRKELFQSGKDVFEHYIPNYKDIYDCGGSVGPSWNDSQKKAKIVAKKIVSLTMEKVKNNVIES